MKVEVARESLRFLGLFAERMIRLRSFDATSAQKGLWLAQKMSTDTLNHAMFMWDVDGELDVAVMESAFRHVLTEAEVLRVNFVDDGSGVRQVIRELGDWLPFFLDLSSAADPEQAAREALADVVGQPFDLERDLLFRLGVVKLAASRSLVVIAYHHLVSDGYGAGGLLSRRLAEVYTALVRGTPVPPLLDRWDAETFAAVAAEYRDSPKFAEDTEFWRTYLADAPAPAQVPRVAMSDSARSALTEPMSSADRWSQMAESIGMMSRTLTVPRAEADAWTETAKSMGVWMSSLVSAAAAVFVRHRCDRPEFLLSLAVGNRTGAAGKTPGLAVNVVPVRLAVPLVATFQELADAVVDQTYEIFGHTACHYSDIQRASGAGLSDRGSFGAVINVVEFAEELQFGGNPARHLGATIGAFDELSIGVHTDGTANSDLFLRLDAPASLYSSAELRLIGAELLAFIRALLAGDAQLPVGALDVVSGAERDRVLTVPDDTDVSPLESTVPELFARQVERAPDAVAVASGELAVSYGELDERSNRLAEALRRRGIGPEAVVAVAMARSLDLVIALLGVAKAGGAHLPIDPASPPEQLGSVLRNFPVRAWLADAATSEALPPAPDVPVIVFDEALSASAGDDGDGVRQVPPRPDNLLAVMDIYGSAGTAAGAAVTHRNLQRLVMDRCWQEGGHRAVLWHSPHTSDALFFELWVPLLNGDRVVVAPPGELEPEALTVLQAANQVSLVWLPTGQFSAVAVERPESLAGLLEVWTGGDRVPPAALRRARQACPELTIVVGHGSTETTMVDACHRLTANDSVSRGGVIGRPMDNTVLYVLGPGLAPVPVGVTGDLYVAGPGVVRGYTGRPGQTAERFVPCPFGPVGGLMYRTGDRARWGAGGLLEYVGPADAQAEIRGVRIDTAEVEDVLSAHPGLAQAVVVVRADESGQQRLVAYLAAAGGRDSVSTEELRRFVAGRLPESMVPSVFVVLERLPTTAAGRVDRASLPEPEFDDGRYRAPRNHTEKVLAEAFADVFELDRVGIDEDFFDLGGNSLRAIRLVGLIRQKLNLEVNIRTLFAARTIAHLSDMREDLTRSSRPTLRKRTKGGEVL